jgi:FKBP-type peptidyl-prolyl cis-trans isomerase
MKKSLSLLLVATIVGMVACTQQKTQAPIFNISNDIDSVSYAIGMNIGYNLIEKDSLLNVDAVCEAIRDVYCSEPRLNDDEARYAFLKYMNFDVYERTKALEQQFLDDLRKSDRKYVATNSGLTYKIVTLGDVKSSSRNSRDTLVMNYRVQNIAGEVLDSTYYTKPIRHPLGKLPKGVQEAIRLIGPGGHILTWVPSALAYSSAGLDSIGVKPNQMLFYEIRLNEVVRR